ncbi:hypothetical protein CK247_29205 [Klebsiella pneumoniae]|nr:hypothetical protein CK247_29205 [Klebsiella pneumoniae]PTA51884.1 hypothetical protein C9I61_28545 [Klebsiella pneumoniae]
MIELILTYLNKVLLFALRKDSLMAFFNLLFVASLICFGGVMGSYSRGCRDSQNKFSKIRMRIIKELVFIDLV